MIIAIHLHACVGFYANKMGLYLFCGGGSLLLFVDAKKVVKFKYLYFPAFGKNVMQFTEIKIETELTIKSQKYS